MNLIKFATLTLSLLTLQVRSQTADTSCVLWDPNNLYCMSCNQDRLYYLVNGNCVRCGVPSCAKIDANGKCVECIHGYYLRLGTVCVVVTMVPGCTQYSKTAPTTVCLACSSNTMLVNGVCLPKVTNCLTYIPGTNLCAQCANTFAQSADWASCVPGGISYCLGYDCLGLCVQCDVDMPRLSVNRNLCLRNIDYCLTYVPDKNLCRTCYSGYRLTEDARGCLRNIQFCLSYAAQNDTTAASICTRCATNYQLSPTAEECWSLIPNCQTYVTFNRTCARCNPGYYPTDDAKACLPLIPLCVVYQTSTGLSLQHFCLICQENYIPAKDYRSCILSCPPDTTYCPAFKRCVVPKCCCLKATECGDCITWDPRYTICPANGMCVLKPVQCPDSNDKCGNCICVKPKELCALNNTCVDTTCSNTYQKYNPATCKCECPGECKCPKDFDAQCKCVCPPEHGCTLPRVINEATCTCSCPTPKEECKCGYKYNEATCSCDYPKHPCGPFEFDTTSCKHKLPSCTTGLHYYDEIKCDCVCKGGDDCGCNIKKNNITCECIAPKKPCTNFNWTTCKNEEYKCPELKIVNTTDPTCPCVCDPAKLPNCLCKTKIDYNTCKCTPYPTHNCKNVKYNDTKCDFDYPSCPFCQVFEKVKICDCVPKTCTSNQRLFIRESEKLCECYNPVEQCRTHYFDLPIDERPTSFSNFSCAICNFTYLRSDIGDNCDSTNKYFISAYDYLNIATKKDLEKLYWLGDVFLGVNISSSNLIETQILLSRDFDGVPGYFYSTFEWQVNFYSVIGMYTIHIAAKSIQFGNNLIAPFYMSSNNGVFEIVGFQNKFDPVRNATLPVDILLFRLEEGFYADGYNTLFTIADYSGTRYLNSFFEWGSKALRSYWGFSKNFGQITV